MTDFIPTTPRRADEGLSVAHTAISRLFIEIPYWGSARITTVVN
jgi:hypothetical protein